MATEPTAADLARAQRIVAHLEERTADFGGRWDVVLAYRSLGHPAPLSVLQREALSLAVAQALADTGGEGELRNAVEEAE